MDYMKSGFLKRYNLVICQGLLLQSFRATIRWCSHTCLLNQEKNFFCRRRPLPGRIISKIWNLRCQQKNGKEQNFFDSGRKLQCWPSANKVFVSRLDSRLRGNDGERGGSASSFDRLRMSGFGYSVRPLRQAQRERNGGLRTNGFGLEFQASGFRLPAPESTPLLPVRPSRSSG